MGRFQFSVVHGDWRGRRDVQDMPHLAHMRGVPDIRAHPRNCRVMFVASARCQDRVRPKDIFSVARPYTYMSG